MATTLHDLICHKHTKTKQHKISKLNNALTLYKLAYFPQKHLKQKAKTPSFSSSSSLTQARGKQKSPKITWFNISVH